MKKIIYLLALNAFFTGCTDNKTSGAIQPSNPGNVTEIIGEYNNKDNDGYLNMRTQPQSDASIIRQIPAEEKFVILENTNKGWTKIRTINNDTGFVSTNRIRVLPNNLDGNQQQNRAVENKAGEQTEPVPIFYNYLPGNYSCDFEKFISDPTTPKLAKQLFNKTASYSEEPLAYFKNLASKDKQERAFYLRVITNSYQIADGAYAEGLGAMGETYIAHCPQEFASFFDNNACFTENDLKIWVDIVMLEFSISDENYEETDGEPDGIQFIKQLQKDCKTYPQSQRETIRRFCNYLQTSWNDHFKKNK
jgi:Bacterial SH3 domain